MRDQPRGQEPREETQSSATGADGRMNSKVAPRSEFWRAEIRPPWASTIDLLIASEPRYGRGQPLGNAPARLQVAIRSRSAAAERINPDLL